MVDHVDRELATTSQPDVRGRLHIALDAVVVDASDRANPAALVDEQRAGIQMTVDEAEGAGSSAREGGERRTTKATTTTTHDDDDDDASRHIACGVRARRRPAPPLGVVRGWLVVRWQMELCGGRSVDGLSSPSRLITAMSRA
jgi:hypothetical protein